MEARGAPRRGRDAARRRVKSGAGPRRGHCDGGRPCPTVACAPGHALPPAAAPPLATKRGDGPRGREKRPRGALPRCAA